MYTQIDGCIYYFQTMNQTSGLIEANISNDSYDTNYSNHTWILDDNGNKICVEPTAEQYETYIWFSWWVEGIIQIIIGCIGFIANSIAIPILSSKEMISMFNRLLTCLAIIDNVFLSVSISEAVRRHIYQRYTQPPYRLTSQKIFVMT